MSWFSRRSQVQPPESPHHQRLTDLFRGCLSFEMQILKLYGYAGYELWDISNNRLIATLNWRDIWNAQGRFSDGWRPLIRVLQQYQDLIDIWEGRKEIIYS